MILRSRSQGGLGLKWGSSIGAWYVPHSRNRHNTANRARVEQIATALQQAGHPVTVEYSDTTRTVADREVDRADRFTTYVSNAAARAENRHRAAHDAVAGIPAGQPVLRGHPSQRHHEAALNRSHNHMAKVVEEDRRASYWETRADAARHLAEHRQDPGRTLRRIGRLQAIRDRRQRAIDGTPPPTGPPSALRHLRPRHRRIP